MGIKITVEFDTLEQAAAFMQAGAGTAAAAASTLVQWKKTEKKTKPNKPAAAKPAPVTSAQTAEATPVREPVAAAGPSTAPDVTDAGFKAWIDATVSPTTVGALQALLLEFGVQKGSELTAEQRVTFIQEFEGKAS